MQYHMLYNGQRLTWNTQEFRATSGMLGFQSVVEQCNQRDAGPIPSGYYKVFLTDHGQAKANMETCALIPACGVFKPSLVERKQETVSLFGRTGGTTVYV